MPSTNIKEYIVKGHPDFPVERLIDECNQLINGCKIHQKDDTGITTTQMRGIFGHVRRLDSIPPGEYRDSTFWADFALLESRIHYKIQRFIQLSGRKNFDENGVKALRTEIIEAIRAVQEHEDAKVRDIRFKRFVEAFETLVAYMPRKAG